MKKTIASAAIILFSVQALAQSDWINIASLPGDSKKLDVQPGSFEFSKTKGGTPIAVVVGKITDTKSANISLYKWYVSLEDCQRKMGKVVSLNVNGEFAFENDFVFGSGSIATVMAETICGVAEFSLAEKKKKSL
ncbi:hypothetical protein [Thiopseudomonas alkaliphila]|uniref:hypothetical protein n=1 Tax=Thiopseudomonas alkaliphila TaxID=1697053 RepID=UPI0025775767|nr:hypothetical protein [Thiopseudomonas alkaliphila]MDM1715571.1 hypothetical protein [Thiopseudomonas alkaliphila]